MINVTKALTRFYPGTGEALVNECNRDVATVSRWPQLQLPLFHFGSADFRRLFAQRETETFLSRISLAWRSINLLPPPCPEPYNPKNLILYFVFARATSTRCCVFLFWTTTPPRSKRGSSHWKTTQETFAPDNKLQVLRVGRLLFSLRSRDPKARSHGVPLEAFLLVRFVRFGRCSFSLVRLETWTLSTHSPDGKLYARRTWYTSVRCV